MVTTNVVLKMPCCNDTKYLPVAKSLLRIDYSPLDVKIIRTDVLKLSNGNVRHSQKSNIELFFFIKYY